jgi:hypothetical protein
MIRKFANRFAVSLIGWHFDQANLADFAGDGHFTMPTMPEKKKSNLAQQPQQQQQQVQQQHLNPNQQQHQVNFQTEPHHTYSHPMFYQPMPPLMADQRLPPNPANNVVPFPFQFHLGQQLPTNMLPFNVVPHQQPPADSSLLAQGQPFSGGRMAIPPAGVNPATSSVATSPASSV